MPTTKKDDLAARIAHLKLQLAPLVPLPTGSPHPDFPKTLLEYHLLTEEQLDALASYYHQSTPGIYTHQYPSCMNWDKEMLSRSSQQQQQQPTNNLSDFAKNLQDARDWGAAQVKASRRISVQFREGFTDAERIAIKRRKVGKFIGLMGCETPEEEIEGRMKRSLERAVMLARDELRRAEEWEFRRSKMA